MATLTQTDELAMLTLERDALRAQNADLIKERDYLRDLLDSVVARLIAHRSKPL